ncbi:MAG TPA: HAD-IA family hydrolase [Candidatus Acidoferrum sp.]|nr:HAD-IA family hydrolase [Candidatus Acidoferrum sp.]
MATDSESLLRPQPFDRHRPTRGLIFDFDGTLVDSYPLIEAAFAHVMRTHRLDEAARDLFRKSRGLPLPEQMQMVAPHMWEDLVATYRSVDATLGHARVFRGIPTLVRKLRQAGVPLGVVSCKRRLLVESELVAAGLRGFFDVVIGFEDVTPPKPAPDPLLAAIGRLGLSRTAAVYVGDSMVDLQTGRAARVRTVLAAWGLTPELRAAFRRHRLCATRPSEMLALVLTTPNGNGHKRAA